MNASTPFRLVVPRFLWEEMIQHALNERPLECCGLLAGVVDEIERIGQVCQRYALVNALASPVRFESDPKSMLLAVKDMRRRDIDVLAVYHSHPTSDPIPSITDLKQNYSPKVVNLIIGLAGEVPQVRAWWLDTHGAREASFEILSEGEPSEPPTDASSITNDRRS